MDEYLQRLVDGTDDSALFNCLARRIEENFDVDDMPSLPLEHRTVFETYGAHGLIGNGGIGYLLESMVFDLPAIADGFDRIGATKSGDALRAAFSVFPNSAPPLNPDDRCRLLEKLDKQAHQFLDHECSQRFYQTDREFLQKLADYIRKNIDAFAALSPTKSDRKALRELRAKSRKSQQDS